MSRTRARRRADDLAVSVPRRAPVHDGGAAGAARALQPLGAGGRHAAADEARQRAAERPTKSCELAREETRLAARAAAPASATAPPTSWPRPACSWPASRRTRGSWPTNSSGLERGSSRRSRTGRPRSRRRRDPRRSSGGSPSARESLDEAKDERGDEAARLRRRALCGRQRHAPPAAVHRVLHRRRVSAARGNPARRRPISRGRRGPGNPLASALRAAREHIAQASGRVGRPGRAAVSAAARAALGRDGLLRGPRGDPVVGQRVRLPVHRRGLDAHLPTARSGARRGGDAGDRGGAAAAGRGWRRCGPSKPAKPATHVSRGHDPRRRRVERRPERARRPVAVRLDGAAGGRRRPGRAGTRLQCVWRTARGQPATADSPGATPAAAM